MSLLTEEEYERLSALASAIPEEHLKNNALDLLNRMVEVISGIGDRDITWQPTYIRIMQGTSDMSSVTAAEGATVTIGSIVIGNTAVKPGFKVIPIALWQSRTLWDKEETNNGRKLCSSPDAKIGWKYGACNQCRYGIGGQDAPPPCNKEYAFLLMAEDFSDMYMLKYHKSLYRAGLDWSKEIAQARVHPFKRMFALNSQAQEKKKTVKEIRASLAGNTASAYSPEAMAFLEAIYKKQVHDRAHSLVEYKKTVEQRLIARESEGVRGVTHESENPLEGVDEAVVSGTADGSGGYHF